MHTGGVKRKEAASVDTAVCAEFDVQLIPGRVDRPWQLSATQLGQFWSTAAVSIMYLKTNNIKMLLRKLRWITWQDCLMHCIQWEKTKSSP